MLLPIDYEDCIDCVLCIPECPVQVICADDDVPANQRELIGLNAELAEQWSTITRAQPAMPDADAWATVPEKLRLLER